MNADLFWISGGRPKSLLRNRPTSCISESTIRPESFPLSFPLPSRMKGKRRISDKHYESSFFFFFLIKMKLFTCWSKYIIFLVWTKYTFFHQEKRHKKCPLNSHCALCPAYPRINETLKFSLNWQFVTHIFRIHLHQSSNTIKMRNKKAVWSYLNAK